MIIAGREEVEELNFRTDDLSYAILSRHCDNFNKCVKKNTEKLYISI